MILGTFGYVLLGDFVYFWVLLRDFEYFWKF